MAITTIRTHGNNNVTCPINLLSCFACFLRQLAHLFLCLCLSCVLGIQKQSVVLTSGLQLEGSVLFMFRAKHCFSVQNKQHTLETSQVQRRGTCGAVS